jgi:hypothetical protein
MPINQPPPQKKKNLAQPVSGKKLGCNQVHDVDGKSDVHSNVPYNIYEQKCLEIGINIIVLSSIRHNLDASVDDYVARQNVSL